MTSSPYSGTPVDRWLEKTRELIGRHPIPLQRLVEITLASWDDIFNGQLGRHNLRIGREIFPQPQIMGFLLHEFIPLNIALEIPGWRRDLGGTEKDVVYLQDDFYSFEIKTSSNPKNIFANRSYAQPPTPGQKRGKDGFMLAVNFEGFKSQQNPRIVRIRFGWLDHNDWIPQSSSTGQQAHLSREANSYKLVDIWDSI